MSFILTYILSTYYGKAMVPGHLIPTVIFNVLLIYSMRRYVKCGRFKQRLLNSLLEFQFNLFKKDQETIFY